MNTFQKLARRVPFLRYCILQHRIKERQKHQEAQWEYYRSTMVMVGQITVHWAGVERLLDELIAWYQQNLTDLQREHPRSLSNKLKYLRLMQCDERLTHETRDWLRQTRIEVKRLGNERHEIIHGMLWHKGRFSLEWSTQRIIYDGPNARLAHRTYHNNDLLSLSGEISTLTGDMAPKVWVITRNDRSKFPVSQIEQALSELGLA